MQNYSRESGSMFPDEALVPSSYKDIDNSAVELISQYYQFIEDKNITAANALLNANVTALKPYIINNATMNFIEEEVYNIGIYAKSKQSTAISAEEPFGHVQGSTWLKEYD